MIHDCGSFTDQVALGLDLGKEPLEAALSAAQKGVSSPHGFRAWFKSNAAIRPVTAMLKNIQTMKPIRNLRPNRFRLSQPEFICVKPDTKQRFPSVGRYDPYKICIDKGGYAHTARGLKFVFLCDKFFTLKLAPVGPPAKFCPRVIDNAFEKAKGDLLAMYQKYVLIHEMAHFYLSYASLGWDTKPKELYGLNQCANMTAENSLRSPMNWHFFVAMVDQHCIDAPDPFAPPFPFPPEVFAASSITETDYADIQVLTNIE
ncbi:MAG: hypothetical protein Q9216_001946 [Gyalolechia sp. 2 TL-2023]